MLIILTGNYNFFNLLTITLCLSLLDDQHVHFWLRKARIGSNGLLIPPDVYTCSEESKNKAQHTPCSLCSDSKLWSRLCYLLELVVWSLMIFGSVVCFDLQLDTSKKAVSSRTGEVFFCFFLFLF